ncbi:MAG: glycoside hydrolase family 32 protein [Cyclobacteriaceae bacterium]|nr:glycoside hydrolase family 32 protein [Cyclobacteriaceae bacterium]
MYTIIMITTGLLFVACRESGTNKIQEETDQSFQPYFQEQHRPQFHFSPERMWMNDPNGMVYYENEFHLFYQYYPDSTVWGPMHWDHAVSTDLIHWEHLPIALYPDALGYIFSGSAVVDWKNTSEFGAGNDPPLVAIFTYHKIEGERAGDNDFQTQGIAYSNDKGRTWTKYGGNPVIPNPGIKDFRDPKVIGYQPSQKWVMVLTAFDHVRLYNSNNLKDWELVSEFGHDQGSHGGVWECPDLFPLMTDTGEEMWVMIVSLGDGAPNGGSGTQYFVGNFDGKTFTNKNPKEQVLWLDYGRDNYAGVTWSDIPEEDGRRIFLGWMSNWKYAQVVPTDSWRSAMTLPRTLELKNTEAGLRLVTKPVEEIRNILGESVELKPQTLARGEELVIGTSTEIDRCLLELTISTGEAGKFLIEMSNVENQRLLVGYDGRRDEFFIDRTASGKSGFSNEFSGVHTAPRISKSPHINLKLFLDVSSVEVFADQGEVLLTDVFFPDSNYHAIRLISEEGDAEIVKGKLTSIKSIWRED